MSEGDWLAAVGKRAALTGVPRGEEFAREVVHLLLREGNAEYDRILAQRSSQARVHSWRALIRAEDDPGVFRFFAFRPQDAICVFGAEIAEVRRWSTLTEIYEACYALATQSDNELGAGMPYSWRLGAVQLARTRWMLLSQPFSVSDRPPRRDVLRVNSEPGRVTALAQQARDDWLAVLAAIDDYPQLAARIIDLEADAVSMAMQPITEAVLGLADPDELAMLAGNDDPVGVEAARFSATRLLLPRFAWTNPTRIYLRLAGKRSLALSATAALAVAAVIVQVLVGFLLPWPAGYTSAAITGVVVYPLITAAMAGEPSAAWPWLLRQPASAAVGLLALAAFGSTWWFTNGTSRAAIVMIGLAAAALLYLYIEAIGHGVRGKRLLRRPPLVTLIGLMHGLLISLIGLRFLLPLFASTPAGGPALSCWYSAASCHGKVLPVPLLLGLASSWSLAAGVFLQIIWDSEPVTATLAHVTWRRGG